MILKFILWLVYGEMKFKVVSRDNGVDSEIQYMDNLGRIVGWYSYGSFDPDMPYQGECWSSVPSIWILCNVITIIIVATFIRYLKG